MYQRVNQEFLENVLKCNALVVRGQAVHHSYQAQLFIITEFKSLNIQHFQKMPPKTYEECATYIQNCFENFVVEDKEMSEMAKKGMVLVYRNHLHYFSVSSES